MPDSRYNCSRADFRGSITERGARLLSWRLSPAVPVAYMAALLISACVPAEGTEMEQRHFLWFLALMPATLQNFLHIPAYALLAFLWRWSLDRLSTRATLTISLALTVGFGVLQEWAQSLVPGRFASFYDVIFDAAGAVFGVWCFQRLKIR